MNKRSRMLLRGGTVRGMGREIKLKGNGKGNTEGWLELVS
jgi:hypothetical protein